MPTDEEKYKCFLCNDEKSHSFIVIQGHYVCNKCFREHKLEYKEIEREVTQRKKEKGMI